MKSLQALIIAILALLVGCAKNSDVAALRSQVASLQKQEVETEDTCRLLQQKIEQLEAADAARESAVRAVGIRLNKSNDDIFGLVGANQKRINAVEFKLDLNADMRKSMRESIKEDYLKLTTLERQVAHIKGWTLGDDLRDWREAPGDYVALYAPWGIYVNQPLAERIRDLEGKVDSIEVRLRMVTR